jgi:hypothetical protein
MLLKKFDMKKSLSFFSTLFFILIIAPGLIYSQKSDNQGTGSTSSYEMNIEEFIGIMDNLFPEYMVDEMTYHLPENLKIVNFSAGDFSGDGLYDVVISYKQPYSPAKTFDVIFLINEGASFKKGGEMKAKWVEIPLDVAFTIYNGRCSVTHRNGNTWHFTTYIYADDALRLISDEEYKQ